MDVEVLVVGAGPTGLVAADVLARGGVSFRVIDKKVGPVEESRALVMHAKSLELLDKLGLAGRAVEEGRRLEAAEVFSGGRPAGRLSFFGDDGDERTPYPFALVLEQDKTERLLINDLARVGGRVEWGTRLVSLTQAPDGVRAVLRLPDGSEETVEAGWVVGADGASSPVRHALSLGFEGGTYEQTLFLADVEMEWPLETDRLCVDLTRSGFYGFFPMPGERRFRVIGSVPPELERREEISTGDIQDVLDRHSGMRAKILAVRWSSVYRVHSRMAERFRAGRVFLAGDAAHIHSPAGGQGMNTGIGDAYNLAWKLAAVVRGEARPALLDSYEPERMPFARSILNGTDRGFSLQVMTDSFAQRLRPIVSPLLFRTVSKVPALRRRAFWLISQLWTEYRDSPAVAQPQPAGRGPKAGDRAPHGRLEDGPDAGKNLFEVLGGVDHHLLLFEEPGRGLLEEDIRRLLGRYEVSVHLHRVPAGNKDLCRRYGVEGSALFLVRPDGHVAYRGSPERPEDLAAYLARWFVRTEPGGVPREGVETGSVR